MNEAPDNYRWPKDDDEPPTDEQIIREQQNKIESLRAEVAQWKNAAKVMAALYGGNVEWDGGSWFRDNIEISLDEELPPEDIEMLLQIAYAVVHKKETVTEALATAAEGRDLSPLIDSDENESVADKQERCGKSVKTLRLCERELGHDGDCSLHAADDKQSCPCNQCRIERESVDKVQARDE